MNIGGYQITKAADHIHTDRTNVFPKDSNQRLVLKSPVIREGDCLDIYVDENLIEIYINDGEYVISNVVYGLKPEISFDGIQRPDLYTWKAV